MKYQFQSELVDKISTSWVSSRTIAGTSYLEFCESENY